MNLKKILTVAAVSVAAAAFALLIVIFAMPKPEDRPPQLNDGTAFFKKYPTLESLLSSEKLEDKTKWFKGTYKKLTPPYQGFSTVSFQWDENAKVRCVCLSEDNPPELSADDEKKRMGAYIKDFGLHWTLPIWGARYVQESEYGDDKYWSFSSRDSRYTFRFYEAKEKYDIKSGKMVREGAKIFIHVVRGEDDLGENGEEMRSDFYQSH